MTPDGRTILAPLPAGIDGHFGPELRRFVLLHYHQGQSTLPRLTALLQSLGVSISNRQVQRLLTDKPDAFVSEAQDVLRAGLETSPYFDKVTLTEMSLCEFAADGHGYRMRTATAKPRAVRTARSCRFA